MLLNKRLPACVFQLSRLRDRESWGGKLCVLYPLGKILLRVKTIFSLRRRKGLSCRAISLLGIEALS